MGIQGLYTFVNKNSDKLLEDYCLQDTRLVIDGHNLLWFFRNDMNKVDPNEHGGEYTHLKVTFQDFFTRLLKCHCQPFVVFDGASNMDGTKRFSNSIREKTTDTYTLGRLLMMQVLEEMNVDFAFSQFEADREIAMLANHWGCPVLGNDSDYFILDIAGGYIPLTTLKWDKARNGCHLPGKLYKLDKFCSSFDQDIKKELIPLFGSLCFNSHYYSRQVAMVLKRHVYRSDHTGKGKRQEKLQDIIEWVSKRTTIEEGLEDVFSLLPEHAGREEEEGPLMTSIGVYDISKNTSSLLSSFFEKSDNLTRDLQRSRLCAKLGAPLWVAESHQKGDIISNCINMIGRKSCSKRDPEGNITSRSAWLPSEPLYSILGGIFVAKDIHEPGPEQDQNGEQSIKVVRTVSIAKYGLLPSLSEIPTLTKSHKRHLILSIFAPNLNSDIELDQFPDEFQLALLVTIYWINVPKKQFSKYRLIVTSLFIGWVYLYKKKDKQQFAKLRRIEREAERTTKRKPDPNVSQLFAEWNYASLYAVYFNRLFQHPLPECPDFSLLYSGRLMHGLVNELSREFTCDRCTLDNVHVIAKRFLAGCSETVKELFNYMYNFVMSNVEKDVNDKDTHATTAKPYCAKGHTARDKRRRKQTQGAQPRNAHPGLVSQPCPRRPPSHRVSIDQPEENNPRSRHTGYTGCHRCGEKNHNQDNCRHKSAMQCHKCKKFGHKAKLCDNNLTN